jgi:[protein-PII] uridylyltransferase
MSSSGFSTLSNSEISSLRRVMPEMYGVNTPLTRMARHRDIIARMVSEGSTLEFFTVPGRALTEMTLCAYDDAEPGLLSKLCGTLSALHLEIHTAFIYTFRDEQSTFDADPARPIALDTFLITENYKGYDRPVSPETEQAVRLELSRVQSGQTTVAHLISRAQRRTLAPLNIYEIRIENRPRDGLTQITLRAEDNPGVLYRSTTALAQLNLNIRAAHASSRDAAADDTFFVTDINGAMLGESALPTIANNLRALLQ